MRYSQVNSELWPIVATGSLATILSIWKQRTFSFWDNYGQQIVAKQFFCLCNPLLLKDLNCGQLWLSLKRERVWPQLGHSLSLQRLESRAGTQTKEEAA